MLEETASLSAEVDGAIDCLLDSLSPEPFGQTPRKLVVVSALAEGADRLVVGALRQRGAELEAVLPLPPDDYAADFDTPESQSAFYSLLYRARRTTVVSSPNERVVRDNPGSVGRTIVDTGPLVVAQRAQSAPTESPHRNVAYRLCGEAVVRRSDVLVAIWDGEPAAGQGGTADVVHYARTRRIPVVWINPDGRHPVVPEIGGSPVGWEALGPLSPFAIAHLDEYNHRSHRPRCSAAAGTKLCRAIGTMQADASELTVDEPLKWITPYFARAELHANFFRSAYKLVGVCLILLSFFAVATVALQELLWRHHPGITWVEVTFLGLAWLGFAGGRRLRLHERWITSRYLAESFRSAWFLAIAGIGDERNVHTHHRKAIPTDDWLQRAFSEVWSQRPEIRRSETDLGPLQRFIADGWISYEAAYHHDTARIQRRKYERVTFAMNALFGLSLCAAVFHSVNLLHGKEPFVWWGLLSIVLPAAGAALTGLVGEREYHQHSQRSARMYRRLSDAESDVLAATTLAELQALILEVERMMRAESSTWFGTVRLHDLELAP